MGIPMRCPGCRERFQAPDRAAGRQVRCPGCRNVCRVPEEEIADAVAADEGERPRRRAARRVEEDDERSGVLVWAWLAGGAAVLMLGIGVAAAVVFWPRGTTSPLAAGPDGTRPDGGSNPDKPDGPAPREPFKYVPLSNPPPPERTTIAAANPPRHVTEPARTLPNNKGRNLSLAVLPDGHRVITGTAGGLVCVYDLRSGISNHDFKADEKAGAVTQVAVSRDGRRAATVQRNGDVKLWDTADWKGLATCPKKPKAFPTLLHLSDDGGLALVSAVAPGGQGDELFLWDVAANKVVSPPARPAAQPDRRGVFFPDGRRVLLVRGGFNKASELLLWNPATNAEEPFLKTEAESPRHQVDSVALSDDGERLLIRCSQRVLVADTRSGALRRVITVTTLTQYCAAVSPDGKYGVVAGGASSGGRPKDCYAHLIDLTTGQEVCRYERTKGAFQGVAFTPDGKSLLTLGSGGDFQQWDVPALP